MSIRVVMYMYSCVSVGPSRTSSFNKAASYLTFLCGFSRIILLYTPSYYPSGFHAVFVILCLGTL